MSGTLDISKSTSSFRILNVIKSGHFLSYDCKALSKRGLTLVNYLIVLLLLSMPTDRERENLKGASLEHGIIIALTKIKCIQTRPEKKPKQNIPLASLPRRRRSS